MSSPSLAATVNGAGPDLVFLHGLFGSGDNLRSLGREFEDRYRVHYPDLPNHGASPHLDHAGFALMSESVLDYLINTTTRPVLAGHSMGAKVAMLCALSGRVELAGLISLDMAPRRYEPSHLEIMMAMDAVPLSEIESRSDADSLLREAIPEPPVRSFLLKSLVKTPDGEYRWRLNLTALIADYDDILGWPGTGLYNGPTLFVGGTRSKYLSRERDADLIASHFPRARIDMIEGAGHWIHSERPNQVRELLEQFLSALA